jgi:Spy/CpxP family protein refolding chaperone
MRCGTRRQPPEEKTMTKTTLALIAAMLAASAMASVPARAKTDGLWNAEAATTVERRKPRVKGGSGCDDPRDLIEHPECR